jgi:RHS repeat-associated protein
MQSGSSTITAHACAFVYRFTGKERDTESGLDYFGARYYASNMGRFMSPDWADKPEAVPYSDLSNPQSLNLYGYVGNNPLSRADADGHCVWDLCLGEGAAAYAAGAALVGLTAFEVHKFSNYINSAQGQADIQGVRQSISNVLHSTNSTENAPAPATSDQPPPPPTRSGALNEAKKDAGVPTSQQGKQETVPVTDADGKQVVVNGKPQTSREYTHTTGDGKTVVIQDHGQGHTFPDGGQVGPHFNVRPPENKRNGTVEGTKPHYPYQ